MDNVFEILIYIIIIVSFLSSIFKKKKPQQQRPPARKPQPEEDYQTEVESPQTQKKEEYDILKELEDFFKVGDEPTERKIPLPQETIEKVPSIDEHPESESWPAHAKSEPYVNEWERKKSAVKKIISSLDSSIEKKAAMFEESLQKKETSDSDIALAVKSKMRNPSTLKEYIIFSEILGKPKALRR